MKISACIPSYNNSLTIVEALDSVRNQTRSLDEIILIDDGSTDDTAALIEAQTSQEPDKNSNLAGVHPRPQVSIRLIRLSENCGRGTVRARALCEATGDFILFCDAGCILPPDFLEKALLHFQDPLLAGLFGSCIQPSARNVIERWRGRHLYKTETPVGIHHHAHLATHGTLLRKASVMAVGNFNTSLRHSEDADLGVRLLAAGYDVIQDSSLKVMSIASNSLGQVLERYWRWHAGPEETMTLKGYLKQIFYSIKVMAREDLKAGDPFSILISLLTPHYQFWRSLIRKIRLNIS